MAIRLLMYIARVYEKITTGKNLYGRRKLIIPRPEFIVLYNGADPYPDEDTLKLPEAFEDAVCGTPGVVREPVSAFLASMPPGERPGKCRNKDNVEGPIAPAASLPQSAE